MIQAYDSTGDFGIARWKAWAPGTDGAGGWQAWLKGIQADKTDSQPDVNFLPPLLRRRLDRHGRMALATAWPCSEGLPSVPCVFASRHGSLDRTLGLLTGLAAGDMLSPTDFSLSVHNSTVGLYSIARGDRAPATAMAAGADSLGMGMIEGANMIAAGAERVLVCYADDVVPEAYRPHIATEPARTPFSVSLLLTAASDVPLRCRLWRHEGAPTEAPENALMRFLMDEAETSVLGVHQPWRLERRHHAH
ncbi:MAG TPA: beta-ketoacyl synthase chain length factor [Gammaproteobacteria bacterium]|nr:beta-ketoacyl synthase chain length factor [Gammaproteobacteria bacterium]